MEDKFRVYDVARARYIERIQDGGIYTGIDGSLRYFDRDKNCMTILDKNWFIKENCTGLKDKNGTLIYDGDWISVDGKYKRYIIWDKKEARFTSKYEDGQTAGFIYNEKDVDYKLEIIGNIHETKEEDK